MVEKAIRARLLATSAVTAICAQRIYAQAAKQADPMPYVTFSRISTNTEPSSSLADRAAAIAFARVQIDAWAREYADAKTLDDEIRKALDGWAGVAGGVTVHACRRIDARDLHEPEANPPAHRASADYLLSFNL